MKMKNNINRFLVTSALVLASLGAYAAPTVEEFLKEIELEAKSPKPYKIDEYTTSPLASYLTREQYSNFMKDIKQSEGRSSQQSEMMEGRILTFNTADRDGCLAAIKEFNVSKEACVYDAENPLTSVFVMRPVIDRDSFERKINFDALTDKQKTTLRSVGDFGIIGGMMFGAIYALPESISKWDKSKGFKALASQYSDRVKAGPVVDKDDWAINYIGHPVSGAFYYTMVRHQGFSKLESAAFSFCMSTFFWEYGIEAFAEVPSIQDLILTPLIGSILGEVFYSWALSIDKNDGKLLGSKRLGSTATVLMNPAGAFANQINKVFKYKVIKTAELSVVNRQSQMKPIIKQPSFNDITTNRQSGNYIGLQLRFQF